LREGDTGVLGGVSEAFASFVVAGVESDGWCGFCGEAVDSVCIFAVYLIPCLVHVIAVPSAKGTMEVNVGSFGVGFLQSLDKDVPCGACWFALVGIQEV
jgi:hypothetical protein